MTSFSFFFKSLKHFKHRTVDILHQSLTPQRPRVAITFTAKDHCGYTTLIWEVCGLARWHVCLHVWLLSAYFVPEPMCSLSRCQHKLIMDEFLNFSTFVTAFKFAYKSFFVLSFSIHSLSPLMDWVDLVEIKKGFLLDSPAQHRCSCWYKAYNRKIEAIL